MSRPFWCSDETLKRAVRDLNRLGLSVYGNNVDLKSRYVDYGCRDYSAGDVVKLRRLKEKGAKFYRVCDACSGTGQLERRRKNRPAQQIQCRECEGHGRFEVQP